MSVTATQPAAAHTAPRQDAGWLGSAAMSVGLARPSLPVANTTSPSLPMIKGRYSLAIGAVAVGRVQ